jgi:hypothetical protein
MWDWRIVLLAGIIFFLIIIILVVYLFFFNRTVPPTAVITNFGVSLSNNGNFITLESIFPPNQNEPIPTLVLQKIAPGDFATSAQGWNLTDLDNGHIVSFIGTKIDPTPTFVATPSGTHVALSSNFNDSYVTFDSTVQPITLTCDNPFPDNASVFILEYDANPTIIRLKSVLPQIGGKDQYLIPGTTIGSPEGASAIGVTIGVPVVPGSQNWLIGS